MFEARCPQCDERMSTVEAGLGGVWSCLYCEGTWLTREQLRSAAPALAPKATEDPLDSTAALQVLPEAGKHRCPACRLAPLELLVLGASRAWRCSLGHGAFFEKGVIAKQAPNVISSAGEAPMPSLMFGILGTILLPGDSWPLIAALAWHEWTKQDP
jgi:ribosomal protein L37AE/L43A